MKMCDAEIDSLGEDTCRDYLRNVCYRGPNCRFKHPPQVLDNFSLTFSFNSQDERTKFGRSMCHDYQNTTCAREGCKYIHCSKEDQEYFIQSGNLPTHVLEDAIVKYITPSLPGEAPVCRDYLHGECRRGKTCKFRHLSHCKYRKELDVLFGVETQSTSEPPICEVKRMKPSYVPCISHTNEIPCVPSPIQSFSQGFFPLEKCKLNYYGTQSHIYPHDQITYTSDQFYERITDIPICSREDRISSFQEENIILKKQLLDLKKQVSDLTAANEFLLEQNANLRLTRKNGRVMTLQPSPSATLVAGTPVNVQPAAGQLVAMSGQNPPSQQIVAAAVPVSIAPVTGAGRMTLSTVGVPGQGSTQQLVPVSCTASGQQIVATVSSVAVAGQTGGSPALLATAVPVSQQQLVTNSANQLVPVSAVPVSLAAVSMASMQLPPIMTAASDPSNSIAMSVSAGTSLLSYPIMTQTILPTR